MMNSGALKGSADEPRKSASKLELSSIRSALIRQEDTIIFALIERSQWKRNVVCYEPGAAAYGRRRPLVSSRIKAPQI